MGLGIVLRDDEGKFLGCHSLEEAEAMGLLEAILWICSLGFRKVCFELYAKVVVDAIHSSNSDLSEFGSIVQHCKKLLRVEHEFSVLFA